MGEMDVMAVSDGQGEGGDRCAAGHPQMAGLMHAQLALIDAHFACRALYPRMKDFKGAVRLGTCQG